MSVSAINLYAKSLLSQSEGRRSRVPVKCVEAAFSLIKQHREAANRLTQDVGAAFRPWLQAMDGHRSRNLVTHDDDDLPGPGNRARSGMERNGMENGEWGVENNAKQLRAGFGAP